ncbi:MAG: VWA domain-containing protein [Bacillota bacterium]
MGFLVPAGLALTAILPGIVALYFLKLRRREREISSTWLWRPVLLDRQANSLWQKLRVSLLLLVQLLAALALILAASHPFATVRAATAANTVILLDGTGAMQATDLAPNRFARAKQEVRTLIDQMPAGGRISLILLTRSPQILVAQSPSRDALRAALDAAQVTAGDGDAGQAMALAYSLLRGESDGQIILVGSGRYRGMGEITPSPVPVTYIPVGEPSPNLAVSSLTTRLVEGEVLAYAQVSNFGAEPARATVEFWADGQLVGVEQQVVDPGESRAYSWAVPKGARELEVKIPAPDGLALDNRAWALAAGSQRSRILLVTPGNPFLARALALIPGAEVTESGEFDPETGADYDLYVFDQIAPPEGTPPGRMLLVNPPGGGEERFVGQIMARSTDPLLRFVETKEIHINKARVHTPAEGARMLWEGETEQGAIPLIWAEGNDRVIFSFALQQSDLVLRVAFPILMQNLAGWLLPPAPVEGGLVQPGESVGLRPWPGASKMEVTLPDGSRQSWEIAPGMNPPYLETKMPGLYKVVQQVGSGTRESRFAVNLFSSLVSDLTPLPEWKVPVLPEAGEVRTEAPRDLWRWLGWLALGLVGFEWWVYRRGY